MKGWVQATWKNRDRTRGAGHSLQHPLVVQLMGGWHPAAAERDNASSKVIVPWKSRHR